MGHDFDEDDETLVKVTRDQDLWIKKDPRSDDIADLSVYLDADEYVETLLEHGVELGEEQSEFLREKRVEKDDLIDLAVERAEFDEIEGVTVAHTYGRCSQNEVSEALRQEGADAVVVAKPEGGMSLRGSDGFERCHEVARRLGGGGHPKAAGCK
ncbi:MAG: recombinase RecJ, partial [Halobacteria archaeon]|nr:recombinase RecJ [Halobacteria archaeon]